MDYTPYYQCFSNRMRELAYNSHMTLKELSEELGTTSATLSRYINGARTPEAKSIIMIARYFNVSTDWLLGLSDERYPDLSDKLRDVVDRYVLADPVDCQTVDLILSKYDDSLAKSRSSFDGNE